MSERAFETQRSPVQALTFARAAFAEGEPAELGLTDKDGAYTNLALWLSDQCRHSIKATRHSHNGPPESRRFVGSILGQIDDVGAFLGLHDWKRVRGLLCAALVQRDYSFTGDLMLTAYPDRVTIMTMGGLADGFARWRNERLYVCLRRRRNPITKPFAFSATEGAFMITHQCEQPPDQKLLDYLQKNDTINRKAAETLLGLHQTAAGKVLRKLYEDGKIEAHGKGKNTKYSHVK